MKSEKYLKLSFNKKVKSASPFSQPIRILQKQNPPFLEMERNYSKRFYY